MCRLTLHQVADPAGVVNEMVRVTRAGGTIAVIDMIVDDGPDTAAESNRLERLRDPSHNRTLTPLCHEVQLPRTPGKRSVAIRICPTVTTSSQTRPSLLAIAVLPPPHGKPEVPDIRSARVSTQYSGQRGGV